MSVLALLLLWPVLASADVLHVYDRLNRLRATVDSAGNTAAIWSYDSVGNITAITRQPATQTTILEIPAGAVAGACGARILGVGFSTTPGENAVTINGVAATVQSATPTELVICVAVGTTTGAVAVTTPTGSDTSATPLPVQTTAAVPTITTFTPGVAVWGTALSVTGASFDPVSGRTSVRMGATSLLASVSTGTDTSLSATVPPGTTSGRVSVITPGGTATALADLFIPPAPYVASDVGVTGRLTLGSSQSLTIPPLMHALLVFDGTMGQRVCVGNPFTTGFGSIVKGVYQPTGAAMFSPYSGGSPVIELGALPATGTYQVDFRNASSTASAIGTATLHDANDQVQGTIPTDGTATTLAFPTPCYRAGRTFTGTAGQRISLVTSSTVNGSATLTIINPDGTTLTTTGVANGSSAFMEPVTLTQSGMHTLWADPSAASIGTLTLRLYTVVDVETPITPNGPPVTVSLTVPGQRAALPFSGTAGQRASVQLDQLGISRGSGWVAQPDGSVLGSTQGFSIGQTRYFETPAFPTTGTYRVIVDGTDIYTGSARVTLWAYTDSSASLTLGVPTPVSITFPGQRGIATFAGTAGQRVTLQTSAATGSLGSLITMSILQPNGTGLFAGTINLPGSLGVLTLPATGTYSVIFDPTLTATGSFNVTVTDMPGATGLTLAWTGKVRDRVGAADMALAPDGALDGTLTVTVLGPTRTVQQLVLQATGTTAGTWDTIPNNGTWIIGAATGLDAALLNAPNGSVSFDVTDGGTFVVFASDSQNKEFVSGQTLTLTATYTDSTTTITVVIVP